MTNTLLYWADGAEIAIVRNQLGATHSPSGPIGAHLVMRIEDVAQEGAIMNEPANGLNLQLGDSAVDDVGASQADPVESEYEPIIREIVELERQYFFEKRNVKTERQRKLRELIERRVRPGGQDDDT